MFIGIGLLLGAISGLGWLITNSTTAQCGNALVRLANESTCSAYTQWHTVMGFFFLIAVVMVIVGIGVESARQKTGK